LDGVVDSIVDLSEYIVIGVVGVHVDRVEVLISLRIESNCVRISVGRRLSCQARGSISKRGLASYPSRRGSIRWWVRPSDVYLYTNEYYLKGVAVVMAILPLFSI
jgi:hypothetical protein